MLQPGKTTVWEICDKGAGLSNQDKHLRCNASLSPAGGTGEPTGAALMEAWVASSSNANTVAAWVVIVLQLRFYFFILFVLNDFVELRCGTTL